MAAEPPKKKRKLPALDDDFSGPARKQDDPSRHQGRIRAHPHVPGQWACHVYVELAPTPALSATLRKAVRIASAPSTPEHNEEIHSLLPEEASPTPPAGAPPPVPPPPLHLSLSRPLMLQTNQRDELKVASGQVAKCHSSFSARYAAFGVLENDDKTRRFLGVELGAGWIEMKELVKSLDAHLAKMRLPTYYENPRFHTSIAWTAQASQSFTGSDLPFGSERVAELEVALGASLRDEGLWVADLCVKVGKDVTRYPLKG